MQFRDATLGTLQPQAFGPLNCIETSNSSSNYYLERVSGVQGRIQGWFVGIERNTLPDSIYYIELTICRALGDLQFTYRLLARQSGYIAS